MRTSVVFAIALLAACQVQSQQEPDVGSLEESIIGGTFDPGDNAVVAVFVGGLCTGTLVAPRVVLTAAHCVADAIVAGNTNVGSVGFGDGQNPNPWIDTIPIVDMTMHRLYKPPVFAQHDIALVRLGRDAPANITPIPMSTRHMTPDDIGLEVRVVGFGNTDGASGSGSGTKRQMRTNITDVRVRHLGFGDGNKNTCQGDSGGPTFMTFDGVESVVGVTSFGRSGCSGLSQMTRVDVMFDDLLTEVMNAWSGPCQNDNVCVEDCAVLDPDCDICGMDGFCGTGCALPDRDCPLDGLASDSCGDDTGCETRLCASAPEDSRVQYCSMPCDPAKSVDSGCFAPLTICEDQGDGTGICGFPGITPGVQGSNCEGGGECRSGICDGDDGICVEACGGDLPECSEGFSCQSAGDLKICALPQDGGCSVGTGSTGLAGAGFLLLAMFWAGRRRREEER